MQTVLVTGASGGIGQAIFSMLLAREYRVIGSARNIKRLQESNIEQGGNFCALQLDVTDPVAVQNMESNLPQHFRQIDILINNAGHDVGGRRLFEQGEAEQWCDIIETNVQGVIRMTHRIIKGMLNRGNGHIVNMGSIAGLKPYATGCAYVASKYAVHGLSETLRLDYVGRGIRVTEIIPGLVRTGFAEQRLGDAEQARAFYDSFDQCLNPEDVAETVLFALQQPKHVEIAQLLVLPVKVLACR